MQKESPLERLPRNLNRKQTLFLDGIRYSVRMAETAHNTLRQTLLEVTTKFHLGEKIDNTGEINLHAMADAWFIIDSVFRARRLFEQMPRTKQKSPNLMSFYKHTEKVEDLRNSIQHLSSEIDNLIHINLPVWGTINWVAKLDPTSDRVYSCSLVAGTVVSGRVTPIINPVGKRIRPPIDLITLETTSSVCISHVMDALLKVMSSIEQQVKAQTEGMQSAGSDLFMCVAFGAGVDNEKS